MDNNLSAGVQSTFTQHQEEIQRRSHIVRHGDDATVNPCHFPRVETDVADMPFVDPEQRFVVFSLSQQEFAPCPEDADNPAVCAYGTFATREEAVAYSKIVMQKHPQFSILVDETHKWILAPSSMARLCDSTYVESKRVSLLAAHQSVSEQDNADFAENVREQKVGKTHVSDVGDNDATMNSSTSADNSNATMRRIHADCRVVDQRFAVVSFVRDDTDRPPEFLFRLYACMDTEAEANQYVRNVCGDNVRDFHIDVVKTCAWAFPQSMRGANVQKEIFRSPELDAVMKTHKKNPQEVERFYKEAAEWDAAKTTAEDKDDGGETGAAP